MILAILVITAVSLAEDSMQRIAPHITINFETRFTPDLLVFYASYIGGIHKTIAITTRVLHNNR